ncbi:MAG: hypothetical protein KatS3mg115_1340 [Candidatus Poribacteria bacterium]|nr:MAG: hypothetical protein KatS3mg115_1340 [Candidatus Poribacteria bacterium]
MDDPLRLTFIGYGSIAEEHAKVFQQLGGVQFDAVVGRVQESAEAFAERFGFRWATTRLEEALEQGACDAVVICSPSDLHAEQACRCLEADRDVLCEIPLATNYPDCERVTELAERRRRVLMVAHTQRYFPAIRAVREMVQNGAFRPYHLVCRWGFLRRENVNWKGRRRSWTDNLLWHHGAHVVDMALWTLGETRTEVVAGLLGPKDNSLGIPLDLSASIRTAGGRLITIAMSYNTPWPFHDYLWIGEEETYLFEGGRLRTQGRTVVEGGARPMEGQNAEFLSAVRERRPSAIDGRAVLPAMQVLQAIQDQNE